VEAFKTVSQMFHGNLKSGGFFISHYMNLGSILKSLLPTLLLERNNLTIGK